MSKFRLQGAGCAHRSSHLPILTIALTARFPMRPFSRAFKALDAERYRQQNSMPITEIALPGGR